MSSHPSPHPPTLLRWLAVSVLLAALGGTAGAFLLYRAYWSACPIPCVDLAPLDDFHPDEATRVLDRSGVEVGSFFLRNRRVVSLDQMPPHLAEAFLAVEDRRFYDHGGVDWRRVLGAALANVRARRVVEGFSTITMQLARNTYPELLPRTDRSFARKIREVRVAHAIEDSFTKEEVLERYLNTIFLGAGAYGVEAAARAYFAVPAESLSVPQAALLAGLPKAPTSYNPYRNPERARQRRNQVLTALAETGAIDSVQARTWRDAPIDLAYASLEDARDSHARTGPYFIEHVRIALERELGTALYRDGLTVRTTMDADLQRRVESLVERFARTLRAQLDSTHASPSTPPQVAVVILEVETGDVLALVGGLDFETSQFNRVVQARRQPGSAFKPFVYAAALEHGFSPTDSVLDAPLSIPLPGSDSTWEPSNFSPNAQPEMVTLEDALARSMNRAAVAVSQRVGLEAVVEAARRGGLESPLPDVPALALGAAEVTPLEMAEAYAGLARGDGQRAIPRFVRSVVGRSGRLLARDTATFERGLAPRTTAALRAMLREVVRRGTARALAHRFGNAPIVGKTGTTNRSTDVWFVGTTPTVAAAVWIGYDRPRPIFPSGEATGGRLAAPLWGQVMARLVDEDAGHEFPAPVVSPAADTVQRPLRIIAPDSLLGRARTGVRPFCLTKPSDYERPDTVVSFLVPCRPELADTVMRRRRMLLPPDSVRVP